MPLILDLDQEKDFETGEQFPKLEMKKEEKARICALSKKVAVALVHFIYPFGYLNCKSKVESLADMVTVQQEGGKPEECFICKMSIDDQSKVKSPVRRFSMPILRYKTDVSGKPLIAGGIQFWLEIFLLGPDKFRQIQAKRKEWGDLREHDLELVCTDAQYQKMDIEIKKDALWMQSKEAVAKYWKEEVVKYDLLRCLGQDIDETVLRRRFSMFERRRSVEGPVSAADVLSEKGGFVKEDLSKVFDDKAEQPKVDIPPVDSLKEAVVTDRFEDVFDFLK